MLKVCKVCARAGILQYFNKRKEGLKPSIDKRNNQKNQKNDKPNTERNPKGRQNPPPRPLNNVAKFKYNKGDTKQSRETNATRGRSAVVITHFQCLSGLSCFPSTFCIYYTGCVAKSQVKDT